MTTISGKFRNVRDERTPTLLNPWLASLRTQGMNTSFGSTYIIAPDYFLQSLAKQVLNTGMGMVGGGNEEKGVIRTLIIQMD